MCVLFVIAPSSCLRTAGKRRQNLNSQESSAGEPTAPGGGLRLVRAPGANRWRRFSRASASSTRIRCLGLRIRSSRRFGDFTWRVWSPRTIIAVRGRQAQHVIDQGQVQPPAGIRDWRIQAECYEFRVVVEVPFVEWTRDRALRHSEFVAIRDDKRPADVHREHGA